MNRKDKEVDVTICVIDAHAAVCWKEASMTARLLLICALSCTLPGRAQTSSSSPDGILTETQIAWRAR
jgi:hypothetical protein